jgi:hypothetical protein
MFTGCRIDTHDPQASELTLALTAVTVGVLARLNNRLLGDLKGAATSAVIPFGGF